MVRDIFYENISSERVVFGQDYARYHCNVYLFSFDIDFFSFLFIVDFCGCDFANSLGDPF